MAKKETKQDKTLDQVLADIEKQFKTLLETDSQEEAFELLVEDRMESTRTQLYEIVKDNLTFMPQDIDLNYKSIY